MSRIPAFESGGGIRFKDHGDGAWSGGPLGKLSKRHCPIHAACTAVKCFNDSFDHVLCRHHELLTDKLLGRVYAEGRSE